MVHFSALDLRLFLLLSGTWHPLAGEQSCAALGKLNAVFTPSP
jgi:hypothetical protein